LAQAALAQARDPSLSATASAPAAWLLSMCRTPMSSSAPFGDCPASGGAREVALRQPEPSQEAERGGGALEATVSDAAAAVAHFAGELRRLAFVRADWVQIDAWSSLGAAYSM